MQAASEPPPPPLQQINAACATNRSVHTTDSMHAATSRRANAAARRAGSVAGAGWGHQSACICGAVGRSGSCRRSWRAAAASGHDEPTSSSSSSRRCGGAQRCARHPCIAAVSHHGSPSSAARAAAALAARLRVVAGRRAGAIGAVTRAACNAMHAASNVSWCIATPPIPCRCGWS